MFKKDVDIGSIIKRIVDERMTVADFARQLNLSRTSKSRKIAYSIFNKKSLDSDMLMKISKILNHNLLFEFFEEKPTIHKILIIEADSPKIDEIIEELSRTNPQIIKRIK